MYRRPLKMVLEELQFLEQQIVQLEQEMANLLSQHQEAVQRLAEVPGLGVASVQQIIAEVGAELRRLPRGSTCLPGWERARQMTRAREYPRATASPRATAKCGAFSINAPTLRSGRKEASSRSCIAASYYARDTIRPLVQLPIALSADLDNLAPGGRYEERGQVVCERLKRRSEHALRE